MSTSPLLFDPVVNPHASAAIPESWWAVVTVLLVLVALVGVLKFLKRLQDRTPATPHQHSFNRWLSGVLKQSAPGRPGLHLGQTVRLTPNHSLHEVTWHGRTLLLACTPQHIQVIETLNDLGNSTASEGNSSDAS